jgi:hypothetical protein
MQMQTVNQIENVVQEVLGGEPFVSPASLPRVQVNDFGGHLSVEVVLTDASRADEARLAIERKLDNAQIFVTVRGVWQIRDIGSPQVLYGQNGSPRAAVLVPVSLQSGKTTQQIMVSITKLAEMELQRIIGTPPNLKEIARIVVENKLKLGGSSSWNPTRDEWLEVASGNAADLSRSLRKSA